MKVTHTPGPWVMFEHSWCETSIGAPSTDNAICSLDINHATEESQDSDEKQMAANARLIAAAPDLLAALLRCRFDSLNMSLDDLAFCHAAIAKAVKP